jgi:hypothetical protein
MINNGNVMTFTVIQQQETNFNHTLVAGTDYYFEKTNNGHGVGICKPSTQTSIS